MKDKKLRQLLWGSTFEIGTGKLERTSNLVYPAASNGEKFRQYRFRTDDGFILTIIQMIEKLEEKVEELENKLAFYKRK